MPANHPPQQAAVSTSQPSSPLARGTAKYTNKDGSKFITVPKANTPTDSAQPSPTGASTAQNSNGVSYPEVSDVNGHTVNRKKQKRRAKAAAKAAAQQSLPDDQLTGLPSPPASHEQPTGDNDSSGDEDENEDHEDHHQNGFAEHPGAGPKKSKKKKKKRAIPGPQEGFYGTSRHVPPVSSAYASATASALATEKIWNTSTQEERARIKAFWLGLGEDERKSLVKVEKDAVLRKMKEQQKHTCSCTVCGRKRTAIEEELEGLYDAYYQELESYANHPNNHDGPPVMGAPTHSLLSHSNLHAHSHASHFHAHQPSQGQIVEEASDDGEDEDEADYSDHASDEEDYSDEDMSDDLDRGDYPTDTHEFFEFGNNLTVQGGILTVADDLLKNDGKKFIEMMEQLAERRMQREQDTRAEYEHTYGNNPDTFSNGHNHPMPLEDEEEYDDEEEGDYEDDGEGDYESTAEEDSLTERQRMEEGRRMFQIFAARMFEQRVLTAYREKVAKERQQKLIQEVEDEEKLEEQRRAKKAREAQKRKDKANKKKEALAEEKARKEAEKSAEEAARLAADARKHQEQRERAEEKRRKKEALKKAEEEERLRKEADRQRRVHEQKEKQAELERKAREAKEREKKAKDEARQKEKEAREQKERESRERKERQDQERRDKESKVKTERDAKEKHKQEARAATKAASLANAPITLAKRPAAHAVPTTVPALPQHPPVVFASPQIPVATPALPKAPTPMRQRQPSQQESMTGSLANTQPGPTPPQHASPHAPTPGHHSPGAIGQPRKASSIGPTTHSHLSSQTTSPLPVTSRMASLPGAFTMPPHMGMSYPTGVPGAPPGFASPPFQPNMGPFRPNPGMMPMPPGLNGPMGGRAYPAHPPPGFTQPLDASPLGGMAPSFPPGLSKDRPTHGRQLSNGFEPGTPQAQPIGRPAPIGRPPSIVHGQRPGGSVGNAGGLRPESEEHLGSSALLDDSDDQLHDFAHLRRSMGGPRPVSAFPVGPFGHEPLFTSAVNPWVPTVQTNVNPFAVAAPGPPPGFGGPIPGVPWGMPGGVNNGYVAPGPISRPNPPRAVTLRVTLCRACEDAVLEGAATDDGFVNLDTIKNKVEAYLGQEVAAGELMELFDTEGSDHNGGGSFTTRLGQGTNPQIRWLSDTAVVTTPFLQQAARALGEIGSPRPERPIISTVSRSR